jgi:uncharacterized protein YcfJ
MKNASTLLIATGALLVGGIATAAFMNSRDRQPEVATVEPVQTEAVEGVQADDAVQTAALDVDAIEYAQVLGVKPVSQKEKLYATVIGSEPVHETTQVTTPHEVCEDVVVQERQAERDGNVGGTVAGAVIGGLLGNQVGGGSGKKAATAAGAIAGGVIGNQVDKRHVGGKVVTRTERQCRTENAVSESTRVTGYNVTYRNADGTTGSMRMASKPGTRVAMGNTDKVTGYDVSYRYQDQEGTVRLEHKPESDRLPVVDGRIVTSSSSVPLPVASRQ